jgi:nicotinamidase/pyrazinamidase
MSTVFFDIDTQIDFMFPAGALYVPGAERILPKVAALNRYAAMLGLPLISTMDAHSENDPEFRSWPPHCVAGTFGQGKASVTLQEPRIVLPSQPSEFEIGGARQLLIEKQTTDCFTNANLDGLLKRLQAEEAVVYGVVTEICVAQAVRGLLRRNLRVTLVRDAVMELDSSASQAIEAELAGAGGQLVRTSQICECD